MIAMQIKDKLNTFGENFKSIGYGFEWEEGVKHPRVNY